MTDETLFAAALELPVADRAAYLNAHCPDPAVRKQVEELLAAADASNPLDRRPLDVEQTIHRTQQPPEPTASVGDRVGPYKLLEKIGEGGMGEVWVADQQEPIKRRVALKLIKPGMDSRSVLGRFEAERQALAVMDHPNIAKVLDAGTTSDGRPYFVMELVKGTPITEFADARKLTPKQRLELFVPVCQAIQHAHMKGIIHRDIKPSNVLVALHDETPVPKVIDFGVAKAVGQQLTEKTIYTQYGALVGTPAYMAPEQATFNQLDVDTRADVYALGVLLYELLAGSPPIERERLKKAALDEVLRMVREEEPPRPSQRLSTADTRASIAAVRGTEPDKLSKLMKGELDWIVMKALEKDRTRRYETANGFAADVQRYLTGEQVQAVPPSVGYRLRKFVRKHKGPVLAVGVVSLAVLLGISGTTGGMVWAFDAEGKAKADRDAAVQAQREADDERKRANAEADNVRTEQDRTRRLLYASRMNAASVALAEGRIPQVVQHLQDAVPKPGEPDLRDWEWHYVNRLTDTGKSWDLPATDPKRMNEVLGTVFPPLLFVGTARCLASFRPVGDGMVFDFHDPATGRHIGQVPKDGKPLPASKMGFPTPYQSADGRYVLLKRPGATPLGRPEESPPRIWEIETGREIDVSGLPPFGASVGVDTLVLGPDAAWVSWLESDTAGRAFPGPGPGGFGTAPLVGPAETTVQRWERGKGMLPPKTFHLGDDPGRVSLSNDGKSVFWLPGRSRPGPGAGGGGREGPVNVKYPVDCWDITGVPKSRWKEPIMAPVQRFTGPSILRSPDLALSPAQTMIGVREKDDIVVYRTADRSIHWTVPLPPGVGDATVGWLNFFVSDDGNRVVFVTDNTLIVREMAAANRVVSRQFHFRRPDGVTDTRPAGNLSFHMLPDGKTVFATRTGGTQVRVWDVSRDPDAFDDPNPAAVLGGGLLSGVMRDDGRVSAKWRLRRSDGAEPNNEVLPAVVVVTRQQPGRVEPETFELPGGQENQNHRPRAKFVDQGRRLLVATYRVLTTPSDPRVPEPLENREWALYDLETPGKLPRVAGGNGHPEVLSNTPHLLNHAPISRDHTTTAFELLDARTGAVVRKHEFPAPVYVGTETFDSTGSRYFTFASPAERTAGFSHPLTVEVWETATQKRLWAADLGQVRGLGTTRARFSPDGQFVVVDYDAVPKTILRVADAHDGGNVKTLELSGNPTEVFSGGMSGTVTGPIPEGARKLGVGSVRAEVRPSAVLRFSPDGRFAVTLEKAGAVIGVWDITTGQRVHSLTGGGSTHPTVVFNTTGTRVFTYETFRNRDPRLSVWDMATGRELLTLATSGGIHRFEDGRLYLQYPDRALDGTPLPEPKK